jgi:hypothetical protein
MPKLSKSFHLEITVEQFLSACSLLELQEIDLLIGAYLQRAERRSPAPFQIELAKGLQEASESLNHKSNE